MSRSKSRRSALRVFREMAAEGYPVFVRPISIKPRQRWRGVISAHAAAQGWTLLHAWVYEFHRDISKFKGLDYD